MANEKITISDCVESAEVMLSEARKNQFHGRLEAAQSYATLSTAYATLALAKIEERRWKASPRVHEV